MVLRLPLDKILPLIDGMKGKFIDLDSDYQLNNSFVLCLYENHLYDYTVYLLDMRTLSLINLYGITTPREFINVVTENYGIYLLTNLFDINGFAIEEFLSYRTFINYRDKSLYNLHLQQLLTKIGLLCELGKVNVCIEEYEPEKVLMIEGMKDYTRDEIKTMLKKYPK